MTISATGRYLTTASTISYGYVVAMLGLVVVAEDIADRGLLANTVLELFVFDIAQFDCVSLVLSEKVLAKFSGARFSLVELLLQQVSVSNAGMLNKERRDRTLGQTLFARQRLCLMRSNRDNLIQSLDSLILGGGGRNDTYGSTDVSAE